MSGNDGDPGAVEALLRAERERERARGRRRAALVLGAAVLACGAAAAFLVLRAPAARVDRPVAGPVGRDALLAPIATAPDPGTGEEVAPWSGFALSVETEPPGALVAVAGEPRGEAPLLADVACRPGEPLEISATRPGRKEARVRTTCREDALVKLRLVLPR